MTKRIDAVCSAEAGCPLYQKGARLVFEPPAVSGTEGGPVCASAVEALQKHVREALSDTPPDSQVPTLCGGCPGGKAIWILERPAPESGGSTTVAASQAILRHISRMSLFAGIHVAKLMRLARLMKERPAAAGEEVVVRGRPGEAFYIVNEGEFEVVQRDEQGVESTLAVLPAGECFGEMSLVTGEPASATVRARGPARLIAVPREDFHRMLAIAPEIALTLARILARRLARTGRWVLDEMQKGLLGRLEQISPAELIQAMNVNGQTGLLLVQNGEHRLTIYMQDGQVAEVELGDKKGEEAFFEFLGWARGQFRFEPVRKEHPCRQIRQDTVGLLLEGMRRVDEARQTALRPREDPPA